MLTFCLRASPAGFINAVSPSPIGESEGWTHVYDLAWPFGFVVSAAVHIALNVAFPPTGLGEVDSEDVFGTFTERVGGSAYDTNVAAGSDSASEDLKDAKVAVV